MRKLSVLRFWISNRSCRNFAFPTICYEPPELHNKSLWALKKLNNLKHKPSSPLNSCAFGTDVRRFLCLRLSIPTCVGTQILVVSSSSTWYFVTCYFMSSFLGCLPPPSPTLPRLPFAGVLSAYRQQRLPNLLSPTFASPKPVGPLDAPSLTPYNVHGDFPGPTLPFF